MFRMIRSAILALVFVSLVVPAAASALPPAHRSAPPAQGLTTVWDWVVSLFVPASPVAKAPRGGIMTKEGSSMDPNGKSNSGMVLFGTATRVRVQLGENGVY